MQNIRFIKILLISALVLLIPLIAMQFTDQVNWTLADFIIAGILLIGTGFLLEFARWKLKTKTSRMFVYIAILMVFLLVWAELAVGLFGTPLAGS